MMSLMFRNVVVKLKFERTLKGEALNVLDELLRSHGLDLVLNLIRVLVEDSLAGILEAGQPARIGFVRERCGEHEAVARGNAAVLDASVRAVKLAVALRAGDIVGVVGLAIAIVGADVGQADEAVEVLGIALLVVEEGLICAGELDLGEGDPRGLATAHAATDLLGQVGQIGHAVGLPPVGLLLDLWVLGVGDEVGLLGQRTGAVAPLADAATLNSDGGGVLEVGVRELSKFAPDGDVEGGSRGVGKGDDALGNFAVVLLGADDGGGLELVDGAAEIGIERRLLVHEGADGPNVNI